MILLTDILIVVHARRLLKSKTPEQGRLSMRGIYLGSLVGLLAAVVGQIIQ